MKSDLRAPILFRVAMLAAIIALAAYLRFVNLSVNPGWYPDEGSDLNISYNLLQGNLQYFSVRGTLLVAARMPLYNLLLAFAIQQFGFDILTARMLTAAVGVLTVPLLYFALRRTLGEILAFASAAVFALMPLAITYNRFAFSYNFQMLFVVLFLWASLELMATRREIWLFVMALTTALALVTNAVAISLIIGLIVIGWVYCRRALLWSIFVALTPSLIYFGVSYLWSPEAFIQDVNLTLYRGSNTMLNQFAALVIGYTPVLEWNLWIPVGILGLFLIPNIRVRVLSLGIFFLTLFNILRVLYVAELGLHRIIGLFPLLALGAAVFWVRAISYALPIIASDFDIFLASVGWRDGIASSLRRRIKALAVSLIAFVAIISPLAFYSFTSIVSVNSGFDANIDRVIARKPVDALAVIDFVNANADTNETVISSPQIGWAIRAKAVEMQQMLSAEGYPSDNYPIALADDRFAYDASIHNARFIIVDNMWREWARNSQPGMPQSLERIQVWPVAFQRGDFTVYRNPAR